MCMFCRSLFVLFLLVIMFSVLLRCTDCDYPLWHLQTLCILIGLQLKTTVTSRSVDYNTRLRNLKVVLIFYNYHVQPVISSSTCFGWSVFGRSQFHNLCQFKYPMHWQLAIQYGERNQNLKSNFQVPSSSIRPRWENAQRL